MKIVPEKEFQEAIGKAAASRGAQELADALHVSRSTITRWAFGANIPFISIRSEIMKYLKESS